MGERNEDKARQTSRLATPATPLLSICQSPDLYLLLEGVSRALLLSLAPVASPMGYDLHSSEDEIGPQFIPSENLKMRRFLIVPA